MRRGCGCGCAVLLLVLVILTGSSAVLIGNWTALAAPDISDAPPTVADIPADYLALYQAAALEYGLDWPILAAVGKVESNHGRNGSGCEPNEAGARGPMQFLRATFVRAAELAGLSDPDICDPTDAIPAAAAYLRSNGAPDDWERALYLYNRADWYPPLVLRWAQRYGHGALLVWPLDGRITQRFGATELVLEPPRCYQGTCYAHFHDGIDIGAPLETPVRAIAAGRVTLAGELSDGAVVVEIEHRPGVYSVYGHLRQALPVAVGDSVVAGEVIGGVGLTGLTTGPHLHLEIVTSGVPVDPLLVLPPKP